MSRMLTLSIAALVALPCAASELGMKPGLWQVSPVKMLLDGQDQAKRSGTAFAQAMANVPPERRAQVEAMMAQRGIAMGAGPGGTTTIKVCVSEAMAKRDAPIDQKSSKCTRTFSRSGGTVTFDMTCTNEGGTTSGHGQVKRDGDNLTSIFDGTNTRNGTAHTIHSETQMTYLGADCGNLKPADAP